MNNVIEFKKDCIMKTMISEITDISLTHDYKIMDDMIEGYFEVNGSYKITKSSIEKEEFMYTIPFSIALSSMINKDTINLTIKDFTYDIDKDVLKLKIALNMDYEEYEFKEEVKEKKEEEEQVIEEMINNEDLYSPNEFHNELMEDIVVDEKDKEEAKESMNSIITNMTSENSYCKYKVYIMRNEDTLESIAIKYNVTLDDLREYNDLENINIGDKIVVPIINDK